MDSQSFKRITTAIKAMKCRYFVYEGPESSESLFQNNRSVGALVIQHRKSLTRICASQPQTLVARPNPLTRAYFRSIRAAEMALWEITGGDCLRSCFIKGT